MFTSVLHKHNRIVFKTDVAFRTLKEGKQMIKHIDILAMCDNTWRSTVYCIKQISHYAAMKDTEHNDSMVFSHDLGHSTKSINSQKQQWFPTKAFPMESIKFDRERVVCFIYEC